MDIIEETKNEEKKKNIDDNQTFLKDEISFQKTIFENNNNNNNKRNNKNNLLTFITKARFQLPSLAQNPKPTPNCLVTIFQIEQEENKN